MKRKYFLKKYCFSQKANAFGLAFLEMIILAGIFITPLIMISMLYVPYIMYFLLAIYVIGSLIFRFAISLFLETLDTYEKILTNDKNQIIKRWSIILSVVFYIVLSIIYLKYFH